MKKHIQWKIMSDKIYKKQVGGDHYRSMVIQPSEFINRNNIPFAEGNAIKYLCRHKQKYQKEDIIIQTPNLHILQAFREYVRNHIQTLHSLIRNQNIMTLKRQKKSLDGFW